MHLGTVYGQPRSCVQFLVACVALEVLCLLMVDEDLVIVKLSVAIPARIAKEYILITAHHCSNNMH